jgi:CBS domain-containing protein
MEGAEVGSLPVFADNRLVGIVTERDLVRALGNESCQRETTIEHYCSQDLRIADLGHDTREVARRMLDLGVRHLPVLRDGELVGIVSMRDLVALEVWD